MKQSITLFPWACDKLPDLECRKLRSKISAAVIVTNKRVSVNMVFLISKGRWLCCSRRGLKKESLSLSRPCETVHSRGRRGELYSAGSCSNVMRLHIDQCLSSISVIRRLTAFLFAGLACLQDNKQQHLWLVSEFTDLEHWVSASVASSLVCYTTAKQSLWKREA